MTAEKTSESRHNHETGSEHEHTTGLDEGHSGHYDAGRGISSGTEHYSENHRESSTSDVAHASMSPATDSFGSDSDNSQEPGTSDEEGEEDDEDEEGEADDEDEETNEPNQGFEDRSDSAGQEESETLSTKSPISCNESELEEFLYNDVTMADVVNAQSEQKQELLADEEAIFVYNEVEMVDVDDSA